MLIRATQRTRNLVNYADSGSVNVYIASACELYNNNNNKNLVVTMPRMYKSPST